MVGGHNFGIRLINLVPLVLRKSTLEQGLTHQSNEK